MMRPRVSQTVRLAALYCALAACSFDSRGSGLAAAGGSETGETAPDAGPTTAAAGDSSQLTMAATTDETPPPGTTTGGASDGTTSGASTEAASGGPGAGTEGETAGALSFETDIAPILIDNCSCHGDGAPSPDLGEGHGYDSIVGVQSEGLKSMLLVQPGSHQDSYLWHKIDGSQYDVGGKGKPMPPSDQLLAVDMALITAWIDEGALP